MILTFHFQNAKPPSFAALQPYGVDVPQFSKSEFQTSRPIGESRTIMKRKLNEDDVPTVVETEKTMGATTLESPGFVALGLDSRLLQAVAKKDFLSPTQVQARAIPLALEGKDILVRSKTGSGKTAAYVLPILQSVLQKKAVRQASVGHLYRC